GTKLWTTNGTIARLLIVMAEVPAGEGHPGGITAFVVESDMHGFKVLRRNAFMGLRGIEHAALEFKDVRVPKETVIGKDGEGRIRPCRCGAAGATRPPSRSRPAVSSRSPPSRSCATSG